MLIYKITNKINGKAYIGQTKRSLNKRWKGHCASAILNKSNNLFHNAIQKYGVDAFVVEQVDFANDMDNLNKLEQLHIESNNSMYPNGYNLKTGGAGSTYSDISKQKMSEAKIGTTLSDEVKGKMSGTHLKRWGDKSLREKKSESSKRVWLDKEYRDKIQESRIKFWSDPENRAKASVRAQQFVDNDFKVRVGDAVKAALSKPDTREKLVNFYKSREKAVFCSNGIIYPSIKSAAKELGLRGSSIIRVIQGRYKSAGGFTFNYLHEDSIIKPIIYLVCGVSGAGKSWVCKQLVDHANYLSFDEVNKQNHLNSLLELSKNGKSTLYDPTFKISTFIKRNTEIFDIRPVFIIENKDIIASRLEMRGGVFTDKTLNRMKAIDKRTAKYATFSGTSEEVLNYLKSKLEFKTCLS